MPMFRVLVVGDVRGKFEMVFNRVGLILKRKGRFDYLFCVGSFFGKKDKQWEHYVQKGLDVPLPVYILGPNKEEEREFYPENLNSFHEYHEKLVYLGRHGYYTTLEGLTIGYVSGLESCGDEPKPWTFTSGDLNFSKSFPRIHVMLTTAWPEGIVEEDKFQFSPKSSSKTLAKLSALWKPYYHFAAGESMFYERTPYTNTPDDYEITNLSRFIALSEVKAKERWIFGVQFDTENLATPNSEYILTDSPYASKDKVEHFHYRYDFSTPESSQEGNKKTEREPGPARKRFKNAEGCWGCLEGAETHRVIYKNDYGYVSLCKGGIVSQHLCIYPIDHISSMQHASAEVIDKITTLKRHVKKYFTNHDFHVIFYERNYKSLHAQIDCVPILPGKIVTARKLFQEGALNLGFPCIISEGDTARTLDVSKNYFNVEFPDGLFLNILIEQKPFPLAFGREVLCHKELFNTPSRVNWKDCVKSKDEEVMMVEMIKDSFPAEK